MKTVEKAAIEYAAKTDKANAEFVIEDFKAGVEFAQQWISVENELPDIDVPVLVKYKWDTRDNVDFAALRRIKNKDTQSSWQWSSIACRTYFTRTVTHWRYIELK
jgi:Protein of unknown function (DUF551).